MSKPIIPFGWLPGHWGLKGKTKERARAEYELEGYDLEIALAVIENDDQNDYEKAKLEIDFSYGVIDEQEYAHKQLDFVADPVERALKTLDYEYQYTDMKDIDYDKKKATINQEPWVNVLDLNVREETGNFELDWNDHFVAELKDAGFKGVNDEDIVNSWFTRICRDIALSEFSGTGNFDEQLAAAEGKATPPADENGRRVIK